MKKYLLILLLISSSCYGQLTTGTQRVSVTTDQSGHVISTPLVFSNQANMIVAASNQQELVRYVEFTNGLAGVTAGAGITNIYNTGAGTGLVFQVSGQVARIASLLPGGSITISSSGGTNITISDTLSITNSFPASSGTNLISSVSGGNINLKTLTPGSNITITDQGTNIVIAASASATGVTNVATTSPIGSNIVQSVVNGTALLKSLSPGTGITITEGVSNLVFATTADALGLTNIYNVGTGTGLVSSVSSRVGNIMTLVPGSNVTFANSGNTNLTINASGGSGTTVTVTNIYLSTGVFSPGANTFFNFFGFTNAQTTGSVDIDADIQYYDSNQGAGKASAVGIRLLEIDYPALSTTNQIAGALQEESSGQANAMSFHFHINRTAAATNIYLWQCIEDNGSAGNGIDTYAKNSGAGFTVTNATHFHFKRFQ